MAVITGEWGEELDVKVKYTSSIYAVPDPGCDTNKNPELNISVTQKYHVP